jgi:hypothetical protein
VTPLLTVSAVVYLVVGWTWMFRGQVRVFRCRFSPEFFGWDDVFLAAIIASACCPVWIAWAAILVLRQHIGLSAYRFALIVGGETPKEKTRRRERELYEREQRIRDLERELGIDP